MSQDKEEIPKISFESFYNQEILPELKELEKERKQIQQKLVLPLLFVTAVIAGIIATGRFSPPQNFSWNNFSWRALYHKFNWVLYVIFGIASLWKLYKNYKHKVASKFRGEFKNKVIRKIVQYIDPNFRYNPIGKISKKDFDNCGIFPFVADNYIGDDLISGIHKEETVFSFSEVFAKRFVRDHRRRPHLVPIFKGLFFKADFNKKFKFVTVVLPDIAEKYLGDFGQKMQGGNMLREELVKLENPEFEKEFSVYSDSQSEARYLLSPKLMQRILDYKDKYGERISLSFANSNIYVTIPRAKDLFEPNYFKSIERFDAIEKYYKDLQMMVDIADELDLNTRIWTKEPKEKKEDKVRKDNHIGGIGYHGRGVFR